MFSTTKKVLFQELSSKSLCVWKYLSRKEIDICFKHDIFAKVQWVLKLK
jgi:hypothetical protein